MSGKSNTFEWKKLGGCEVTFSTQAAGGLYIYIYIYIYIYGDVSFTGGVPSEIECGLRPWALGVEGAVVGPVHSIFGYGLGTYLDFKVLNRAASPHPSHD